MDSKIEANARETQTRAMPSHLGASVQAGDRFIHSPGLTALNNYFEKWGPIDPTLKVKDKDQI